MMIFVSTMIFATIIIFVIFGFSIKYSLRDSDFEVTKLTRDEINSNLPSIKENITASLSDIFGFGKEAEEEVEGMKDIESQSEEGGYRLPVVE